MKTNNNSKIKFYSDRLQAYLLDYSDDGLQRHTMAEEEAIFKQIETGDISALEKRFSTADINTDVFNRVGKMADRPIKSFEYMTCISIALASRAAVRGGVDLDTAYTLTDVFLRSLEKCHTIDEILNIQIDAFYVFTEQVNQTKMRRSNYAYIENAKAYIENHLNRKFTCTIRINGTPVPLERYRLFAPTVRYQFFRLFIGSKFLMFLPFISKRYDSLRTRARLASA